MTGKPTMAKKIQDPEVARLAQEMTAMREELDRTKQQYEQRMVVMAQQLAEMTAHQECEFKLKDGTETRDDGGYEQKMCFILNSELMCQNSSKYLSQMLSRRRCIVYNS